LTDDDIGNILEEFYKLFGRPEEGPPPDFNVSRLLRTPVRQKELDVLRNAMADTKFQHQFVECQQIAEDLVKRLTGKELLRDLSGINLSYQEFEGLYSRGLWFSLASTLDKRKDNLPLTPFDSQIELPLPVKIMMTIQGSLVIRLYIALVCMREGVLYKLISQGASKGSRCCQQIKKLLNSDYLRRIRNAVSHGTFTSCVAGLVFYDKDGAVVATPGFLEWLGTWIMIINLQAVVSNKS
jgi:hypothetical protein